MKIENSEIVVNHQPSGGKEWVAKIKGLDSKYGFQRDFLRIYDRDWSSSGKTGCSRFLICSDGIYEINEPWKGRKYVSVVNGTITEIKTIPKEAFS